MKIETPQQAAQIFGLEWREGEDRPDGHTFIVIGQTIADMADRILYLEQQVEELSRRVPFKYDETDPTS